MLADVALTFLKLGLTSFGGPVAHIGYLRRTIVEQKQWLGADAFAELVALCQFLPGPASSQLVFALGRQRAGWRGAVVASACFTAPSALLMALFALGVARVDVAHSAWLRGLSLAAVGVVAHAVWSMARAHCVDRARLAIALATAGVLVVTRTPWAQLVLLGAGAAVGVLLYRGAPAPRVDWDGGSRRGGALALATCALLLAGLPVLARATGTQLFEVMAAFTRAGSLVFGGGHVVLPLLRAEVVPTGWLTDAEFLAGYAAAQAVPGPLFSFAAYLGAAMAPQGAAWVWALTALLALFMPGWLLVAGALPYWRTLRAHAAIGGAVLGANAAVVGVLLASLYRPVLAEGVRGPWDAVLAVGAFGALCVPRVPAWAVVAGCVVARVVLGAAMEG